MLSEDGSRAASDCRSQATGYAQRDVIFRGFGPPPGGVLSSGSHKRGENVTGVLTRLAKNGKHFLDLAAPLENARSDCVVPGTVGH